MVKNPNLLFKIEYFVLIVQIYVLYDFAKKNISRYYYHAFIKEVRDQIKQKKLNCYIIRNFYNVFSEYSDSVCIDHGVIILIVWTIHFLNFIFLIIGFYIHKNKTNANCKNICVPIFLFSINLLTSFFEFYFEFFYEISELGLTEAQLNAFNDFKEKIINNLNSVSKRIIYLKIDSILLIICSIIHIILTIILRNTIKNKKTSASTPSLETEKKDMEENSKINSENCEKFIKFENGNNGLYVLKFILFINKKLGI